MADELDTDAEGGTPQAGAAPDTTREDLARLKAESEQMRRSLEQQNSLLAAALSGGYTSNQAAQPQHQPYQSPVDDDPDLSDDERRLLRKAEERAEKKFRVELEQREQKWMQGYSSNVQQDAVRWASLERERVFRELDDAGLHDLKNKVDEYVRSNNVPVDYLKSPGAWKTIANTVAGEAAIETARANARRAPALGSSIGRPNRGGGESYDGGRAGAEESEFLANYGIEASPDEIEYILQNARKPDDIRKGFGGMSAADFNKATGKKKRAS